MHNKKTLGGSKKLLFQPKKAKNIDLEEIEQLVDEEKPETGKQKDKKFERKKLEPKTVEMFSALPEHIRSNRNLIEVEENDETELYSTLQKRNKVQEFCILNNHFEDDIMYLFCNVEFNLKDDYFLRIDEAKTSICKKMKNSKTSEKSINSLDELENRIVQSSNEANPQNFSDPEIENSTKEYELCGFNCDRMTVTKIGDQISEIGNVFYCYMGKNAMPQYESF
ncbi:hypothetical protein EDEG_04073 [Edhazardia aedis USNM 41457]|uniref:Uncharacterized protein n=1 Tax=Edhazardia aedis (strain USNM 41457) TaxID=1003232 RepID=J9DRZ4_EDHAE|nr:hypothetical protein EDEG_04073 [Edhazardia aedis USNM 41457]|eukprot:EJW05345.1 hypothetical protein EDEG_04073 [Edhazardia aedis USNM 41457]